MSRQQERAALRRKYFRRMAWNESHQIRNPRDGSVIETIGTRRDRRKFARAFAIGEWNKNKAVA